MDTLGRASDEESSGSLKQCQFLCHERSLVVWTTNPNFGFFPYPSKSAQSQNHSKSFKVTKFYKLKMDPEWFDLGRSPSARRRSWPLGLRTACAGSGWPFEDTLKPSSATTSAKEWGTWLIYQTSGNLMLEKDGKSARCGFRVSNFCPFWFQTIRTQGNKGGRAAAPCQADQRCALVFSTGSRVLTSTAWKVMICKWFNDNCHDDTWYAWYVMTM